GQLVGQDEQVAVAQQRQLHEQAGHVQGVGRLERRLDRRAGQQHAAQREQRQRLAQDDPGRGERAAQQRHRHDEQRQQRGGEGQARQIPPARHATQCRQRQREGQRHGRGGQRPHGGGRGDGDEQQRQPPAGVQRRQRRGDDGRRGEADLHGGPLVRQALSL